MGFEPTTSSMPSRRAPSCATAPPEELFDSTTRVSESGHYMGGKTRTLKGAGCGTHVFSLDPKGVRDGLRVYKFGLGVSRGGRGAHGCRGLGCGRVALRRRWCVRLGCPRCGRSGRAWICPRPFRGRGRRPCPRRPWPGGWKGGRFRKRRGDRGGRDRKRRRRYRGSSGRREEKEMDRGGDRRVAAGGARGAWEVWGARQRRGRGKAGG